MKLPSNTLFVIFLFFLAPFKKAYAQSVFPIRLTDDGHILIQASINGVIGDFLLDTGAGLTVITRDYASGLDGLKKLDGGYTAFRATGERLDLDLYSGNEIRIGDIPLQKSTLSIIDMDWPIDGILSLMSFRNQPFTIDFEQKKLCLESQESLAKRQKNGHVIPLQLEDARGKALDMFTYIAINDTLTLQASLDSGAGYHVFRINSKFMQVLGIDSTTIDKLYKQGSFDQKKGNMFYKTKLKRMSLASSTQNSIEDFAVTFVKGLIYDAIVPIQWIATRVTIDLADKQMIIE